MKHLSISCQLSLALLFTLTSCATDRNHTQGSTTAAASEDLNVIDGHELVFEECAHFLLPEHDEAREEWEGQRFSIGIQNLGPGPATFTLTVTGEGQPARTLDAALDTSPTPAVQLPLTVAEGELQYIVVGEVEEVTIDSATPAARRIVWSALPHVEQGTRIEVDGERVDSHLETSARRP